MKTEQETETNTPPPTNEETAAGEESRRVRPKWLVPLVAGLCTLALVVAGPPQFSPAPSYWLGFLYLGVFASAIAFALYFDLIRQMGPAEAAWTSVLIPIIAMAISTFAEGYRWTPLSVGGCALALAGMVIALRQPARKAAAA